MRKALLRHLSVILGGFAGKNAREDAKLGDDLAANVAKLEMSLGLDWRLQHSLLMAVPAMAQVEFSFSPVMPKSSTIASSRSTWYSTTLQGIMRCSSAPQDGPQLWAYATLADPSLVLNQNARLKIGHSSFRCCRADNEHRCLV